MRRSVSLMMKRFVFFASPLAVFFWIFVISMHFRYRIWPLLKNNEEKVWIFIYIMVQLRMLKT